MNWIEKTFGKPPSDVSLDDIQSLIDNKVEENHNLEYKGVEFLSQPERLSQWISAFLNAEGGLLILGLREDDPDKKKRLDAKIYPTAMEFVSPSYTRERIDQLIHSGITGDDIPRIAVLPIRNADGAAIYLVDVPQGQNPPYQASDDKYYRRLNYTKIPMRHYEIADFFGRRRKPQLKVTLECRDTEKADNLWNISVRLFLTNVGKATAKHTTFICEFPNASIANNENKPLHRLDDLRGGIPSIQWSDSLTVLHPVKLDMKIADLRIKQLNASEPVTLRWDLVCEDMELIHGQTVLDDSLLQRSQDEGLLLLAPSVEKSLSGL